MAGPEFFARCGLYVTRGFFNQSTCAALCEELRAAKKLPALVVDSESYQETVKRSLRQTFEARVQRSTADSVKTELSGLLPALSRHFGTPLMDCDPPQFLVYKPGDYFQAHCDADEDPAKPEYVRRRRVSVVVFLNGPSACEPTAGYRGGSLTFYGLVGGQRGSTYGCGLDAEPGLLVGFPSNLFHEVTPIVEGERLTLVTWFF